MARKRAGADAPTRNEHEEPKPNDHRMRLNALLEFWRVCGQRSCRRVHACAGDADRCLERHWPMMPEEFKIWFRAVINALADGHSLPDTARIVKAELERWRELTARYAAPAESDRTPAQPGASAPSEAETKPPPMPSVRSL